MKANYRKSDRIARRRAACVGVVCVAYALAIVGASVGASFGAVVSALAVACVASVVAC